MKTIKRYEKFKSYKTVFAVFLITVVLSSVLGYLLYCNSPEFAGVTDAVGELFSQGASPVLSAILFELVFILGVFVAGPTIYAPVSSFSAVFIYGALFGAKFASKTNAEIYIILTEVFFFTVTAYLLVVYSSFVTLTGLRIFTDVKTEDKRELFDGVLFRAERFKGIFNFRYIASYIMFFLLFLALLGVSAMFKVFLLSL